MRNITNLEIVNEVVAEIPELDTLEFKKNSTALLSSIADKHLIESIHNQGTKIIKNRPTIIARTFGNLTINQPKTSPAGIHIR